MITKIIAIMMSLLSVAMAIKTLRIEERCKQGFNALLLGIHRKGRIGVCQRMNKKSKKEV